MTRLGDADPITRSYEAHSTGLIEKPPSNVTHPSHYNSGKIEVIEAIEDWNMGFHRGNAIKYIARAGRKDPSKTVEDLEKANWYIAREIERLKASAEGRTITRPNDMNPRKELQLPDSKLQTALRLCKIHFDTIKTITVSEVGRSLIGRSQIIDQADLGLKRIEESNI